MARARVSTIASGINRRTSDAHHWAVSSAGERRSILAAANSPSHCPSKNGHTAGNIQTKKTAASQSSRSIAWW
jgi:hypothetical protein